MARLGRDGQWIHIPCGRGNERTNERVWESLGHSIQPRIDRSITSAELRCDGYVLQTCNQLPAYVTHHADPLWTHRFVSCRVVSCWATFSISHGTQDLIPSTKCPSSTHPQSWTIHHICFPHHFPLSTTCICGLIRTHKTRAKTGSFAVWTFRYLMRRVHDQITHKTKSTGNISTNY